VKRNKVAQIRKKLGWTQDKLSEKSSIDRRTISKIETEGQNRVLNPSWRIVALLCDALGEDPYIVFPVEKQNQKK
jgi:DNA-binding XRE family transcriptional regulator